MDPCSDLNGLPRVARANIASFLPNRFMPNGPFAPMLYGPDQAIEHFDVDTNQPDFERIWTGFRESAGVLRRLWFRWLTLSLEGLNVEQGELLNQVMFGVFEITDQIDAATVTLRADTSGYVYLWRLLRLRRTQALALRLAPDVESGANRDNFHWSLASFVSLVHRKLRYLELTTLAWSPQDLRNFSWLLEELARPPPPRDDDDGDGDVPSSLQRLVVHVTSPEVWSVLAETVPTHVPVLELSMKYSRKPLSTTGGQPNAVIRTINRIRSSNPQPERLYTG
jgi:hypothetical protein